MTQSYLKAAFGERFDSSDAEKARAGLKAFTASWRGRLPAARRILGILNPLRAPGRRS